MTKKIALIVLFLNLFVFASSVTADFPPFKKFADAVKVKDTTRILKEDIKAETVMPVPKSYLEVSPFTKAIDGMIQGKTDFCESTANVSGVIHSGATYDIDQNQPTSASAAIKSRYFIVPDGALSNKKIKVVIRYECPISIKSQNPDGKNGIMVDVANFTTDTLLKTQSIDSSAFSGYKIASLYFTPVGGLKPGHLYRARISVMASADKMKSSALIEVKLVGIRLSVE